MRKRKESFIGLYKMHLVTAGLLLSIMAACNKNSDPGPDANAVLQSNLADIKNYAASKGLSGSSTSSGLYYVLKNSSGSSITPAYGQEVEINYVLYTLTRSASNSAVVTDTKVDSAYTSASKFGTLTESSSGLIEGLLKMHEGDQTVLLMPSTIAFGGTATGIIPANSPVRLDVRLKRTRTEEQQIDEYLTANKLTPTEVTTSGLRFVKTASNSSGILPTANQTYIIKYTGRLLRATSAFDSTGTGTYRATLGNSIPGFDEGLAKLRVGEKATIIFPSKLGYGKNGSQNSNGIYVIPPYAPLRFDIEVVSAQ
jgi:FKBP-type peptidyl-prolyl cis-trans isomerase